MSLVHKWTRTSSTEQLLCVLKAELLLGLIISLVGLCLCFVRQAQGEGGSNLDT